MRKIFLCMLLVLLFLNVKAFAQYNVAQLDEGTKQKITEIFEFSNIDIDVIDFINKITSGNFDFKSFFSLEKIANLFGYEFKNIFKFISPVFVVVMLSALINNADATLGKISISNIAVTATVVLSLINITYDVIEYTITATDKLVMFVNALLPILLTLVFSAGKMGTSAVLNPLILYISAIITLLVKDIIIPFVLMSLAVNLSGEVLEKPHLVNLGEQITKILKWILGIIFTVYIGVVGIIGVVAPKVDDITLKTTKYAVSTFIPYVGGMVAESVELILECSTILKNAVGIAGLLGVISIVGIPCISIAVRFIVVNIFSFVVAPVSEKAVINSINHVASCLGVIWSMNVVVAVVYIIFITVIIFVGGA